MALRDQILGLKKEIAEKEKALAGLHSERDELAIRLAASEPVYMRAEALKIAIEKMDEVWNGTANEAECERVLRDNLWVLAPDYIRHKVPPGQLGLANLADFLFPGAPSPTSDEWIAVPDNWRPDIAGLFWADASLQHGQVGVREPTLLLLELKKAAITGDALEQAHAYAFSLMQRNREKLWGERIDCLVIGRQLAEGLSDVHLRWGPAQNNAIHITPLTYNDLLARAKRIYDLLVQHDAEIIDFSTARARLAS
jgi:hypothetical protein